MLRRSQAALLSILATEQLLTIDIYTGYHLATAGKTYVRIGLPTFEITMDDLTLNVGLCANSYGGKSMTGTASDTGYR